MTQGYLLDNFFRKVLLAAYPVSAQSLSTRLSTIRPLLAVFFIFFGNELVGTSDFRYQMNNLAGISVDLQMEDPMCNGT
jgi:hypothetical protein